jgi:mannose-6-phosphate isomerase-like protein (cupin superfamily)
VAERRRSVVRIDEGRPFHALGATVRRLIHPTTVGSKLLGVSICLMEPGDEIRRHRHSYEEAYFVVRGNGAMYLEGEGFIRLEPGLSVYVPPDRVHGQVNDGDEPLHIICSLAPPPVEGDLPRFAEEPRP